MEYYMKTLKIAIISIISFVVVVLAGFRIYEVHFYEPIDPYIWQGHNIVFATQQDDKIQYFVMQDPYSVYNYLAYMNFERAETAKYGKWIYRVDLIGTLDYDKNGVVMIPNTNESEGVCKIYVYEDCIDINGITYKFPEGEDVFGWFDTFYKNNYGNYEIRTVP